MRAGRHDIGLGGGKQAGEHEGWGGHGVYVCGKQEYSGVRLHVCGVGAAGGGMKGVRGEMWQHVRVCVCARPNSA